MRIRGIRKAAPAAVAALAIAGSIVAAPQAMAVAGGTASTDAASLVQIFYNGEIACGGTLLDAKHIVTARRCLVDGDTWREDEGFSIRVGDHRLGQGEAVESCGTLFRAVVPPGADPGNTELWQVSDIAVLYLADAVQSTKHFAELGSELPKIGANVKIKGWGHGGDLKEAAVRVTKVNSVIPGADGLKEGLQLKDITGHAQRRDVGAPVTDGGKLAGVVATPNRAVEVQPYLGFLQSSLDFAHPGCEPGADSRKATGALTLTS